MSTLTAKLGLLKPAGSDFVDEVSQLNDNWDNIDDYAVSNDNAVRQNPFSWIFLTANLPVANVSLAVQFNGTGVAYAGKGLTIAVSGANGRFTPPVNGWYRFGFYLQFTDSSAVGNRAAYLIDQTGGGATIRQLVRGSNADSNELEGSWPMLCTAGNNYEIHPFQSSGSSRNLVGGASDNNTRSYITCELIRAT